MLKRDAYRIVAAAGIALGLSSAARGQVIIEVHEAYIERPPGAGALVDRSTTASGTIELYRNRDLKGDAALINVVGAHEAGAAHDFPNGVNDSLSSLRWSLPPGVLVVLYEDAGAKGEQLALWGSGQIGALSRFDFNDKASQWAWFYVGGRDGSSADQIQQVRYDQALPLAINASPGTAPVPQNTVQFFKGKNFDAKTHTVSSVTSTASNTLHELPGSLSDSLTAMRWSLPPGVVVMIYQDADGGKQQVPIWGNGQVANLDVWDFNDKASRWAWYYIGSPYVADDDDRVLGYVPPHETAVVPERPDLMSEAIAESIPEPVRVEPIEVRKEPIALIGDAMIPTELDVDSDDLRARDNPVGAGTFVYVDQTQFNGVERYIIWLVLDDKAYALTGAAKMITPTISLPKDSSETGWAKTGINQLHAEEDSAKIVFNKGSSGAGH